MTTMIIDTENGIIMADSRGTETSEVSNWKILPYPRKVTNVENKFSKVKKVFAIDSHIVSGSGSLILIEHIRDIISKGVYNFKEHYILKSEFDFSNTNVYITKKTCGENHCLWLKLKTKRLPFNYQLLKLSKEIAVGTVIVSGSGSSFAI